jgi:hypothetical protein
MYQNHEGVSLSIRNRVNLVLSVAATAGLVRRLRRFEPCGAGAGRYQPDAGGTV